MLVLTRRPGEAIVLGDDIRITILDVKNSRVRIGISAPPNVPVDRSEVHHRKVQELVDSSIEVPQ